MPDGQPKRVFVSYVRDDSDAVDRLCALLEAAQIPYWRDRTSLAPGDAWKAEIRKAIRDGSLVFLACFSEQSRGRDKSTMNEELTLAVEEFRKMPPGRTWLVPVRLDDGPIPEWDLGAGRVLGDLNYSDMFGEGYAASAVALVTMINRLIGEKRPSQATALAAVEQAIDADRASLLTRLTKEMLPDPSRRIELDDLVSQEVRRIVQAIGDPERFPLGRPAGSADDQVLAFVELAQRYWTLVEPFCHSLAAAIRWGEPAALAPWAAGVKGMVSAANKLEGGSHTALALRGVPGMASVMVAGLASVSAGRWDNLKALVIDPTIVSQHDNRITLRLIEATDPWAAFNNDEIVANVLARTTTTDVTPEAALQRLRSRGGKLYTPIAEWLHAMMRPVFAGLIPDADEYDLQFDYAEVFLGLLSADCSIQQSEAAGTSWRRGARWFGRSTHRAAHMRSDPVGYFDGQLRADGTRWAPLDAGLFGASEPRARMAIDAYAETFNKLKDQRF